MNVRIPKENHTLLTPKQVQVLRLRSQGLSQAEVALRLGFSRAAVSMLESRARNTVSRAEATVNLYKTLARPLTLTFDKRTRVYDIPPRVYSAADASGIHVKPNLLELIEMIRHSAGLGSARGRITRRLNIKLFWDGRVAMNTDSAEIIRS